MPGLRRGQTTARETDPVTAEFLHMEIAGLRSPDRAEASDFFESAVGEEAIASVANREYLRGFAEGAIDIWRQVRGEI